MVSQLVSFITTGGRSARRGLFLCFFLLRRTADEDRREGKKRCGGRDNRFEKRTGTEGTREIGQSMPKTAKKRQYVSGIALVSILDKHSNALDNKLRAIEDTGPLAPFR